MWKTSVVAEVHDPKLDFSRFKHICCYFHPPLNIPEAGLSSHCTPISYPPAIWQHFSVFIPHLFLFDSRLLLSLKCLLWEIVCKGPPFLSTSSSEVIFFPGIYCTAKVPGSRLYLCGCDGCVGTWSCMHTRLPPAYPERQREAFQMIGWLLAAFSPRTVKWRAQSLGLLPLSPRLQATCEGCSDISTCWPERRIWLLVKSARALFIQQLCSS